MARVKKSDVQQSSTSDAANSGGGDSKIDSSEKKTRKPNSWNLYYKEQHPKYKSMEEHKGKSHQELTKCIAAAYKLSKETKSSDAPATEAQ